MNTKLQATISIVVFQNGYVSFQTEGVNDSGELIATDLHTLLGAIDLTKSALVKQGMESMGRMQERLIEIREGRINEEIQNRATKSPVSPSAPEQSEGSKDSD